MQPYYGCIFLGQILGILFTTNWTLKIHCQPELVEGGFTLAPGFDNPDYNRD